MPFIFLEFRPQPNSLSSQPGRPARGDGGRIREWLEARHDQPVGVVDLAAAMGLSVRRVQDICRRRWDQTPMQLLRGIRLDHARDTLLADGVAGTDGVAAVAGFRRMDRFTAASGKHPSRRMLVPAEQAPNRAGNRVA